MAFGIPYCGSKNIYARKICDALPAGERLVDLFAGGCAITDCAMKKFNNKWKKFLINDIKPEPIKLYVNCLAGKNPVSYNWVSREEFKKADWATRLVWSFANDLSTYIYSKKEEDRKHDVWDNLFSNDFDGFEELYRWYQRNIGHKTTQSLDCIVRLHRLESLKSLDCPEYLETSYISYLEYNLDNIKQLLIMRNSGIGRVQGRMMYMFQKERSQATQR